MVISPTKWGYCIPTIVKKGIALYTILRVYGLLKKCIVVPTYH